MVAGLGLLAGCTPAPPPSTPGMPASSPAATPTRSPSPSPTPSKSGSPSLAPEHDLFTPGLAREVVAELVAAAEWKPVVRITMDRTQARLTYVDVGNRPRSMVWLAGEISPSDDGTDLVEATSFDPSVFDLSDVAGLFATAAEVAESDSRQELQITEYDHGQVLITVTTTPESSTVFFDASGQLIPRLDYTDDADIATALADVTAGRLLVLAVGIDGEHRVWADVVAAPGVIERRFRAANVPMYSAQRRESPASEQFDHDQINPATLGLLLRTGAGLLDQSPDADVLLLVNQPDDASAPRITVSVNGQQLVTDLNGVPVTEP